MSAPQAGTTAHAHKHKCIEPESDGLRCASRGYCVCECGATRAGALGSEWGWDERFSGTASRTPPKLTEAQAYADAMERAGIPMPPAASPPVAGPRTDNWLDRPYFTGDRMPQVAPPVAGTPALTLQGFQEIIRERATFFPSAAKGWSLPEWTNALAGEVGEACNITKKIHRGDFTLDEAREALADELADVFSYLNHVAHHADIDLEAAVRRKFNIVSAKWGAPQRL